jgi:hypothetical protein
MKLLDPKPSMEEVARIIGLIVMMTIIYIGLHGLPG